MHSMPSLPPGLLCLPNLFELIDTQAESICRARNIVIVRTVYNEHIDASVNASVGMTVDLLHFVFPFCPRNLRGGIFLVVKNSELVYCISLFFVFAVSNDFN